MSVKDIKIGTKIELEVVDNYNNEKTYFYVSQLLDFVDENNIIIAAPIKESRVAFIPNSTPLQLIVNHPKHGIIAFEAILTSKDLQDNVAILNVRVSSDFYKKQRRDNYRLEVMLDVFFKVLDDTVPINFGDILPEDLIKAFTKNLSGSGASIITSKPLALSSHLYLNFILPNGKNIEARCVVVRCSKVDSFSSDKFNVGLKFTGINKIFENALVKFIFDKQKDLLKQKKT